MNRDYLEILGVTHCVCWGSQVYNSLKAIEGYVVKSEHPEGVKGFSSAVITRPGGKEMHVLRVFHPSMPTGFKAFSSQTHQILQGFFNR